jgi:hypothetical protein
MKTYEIWAEIVECEDGVQIDDVGDPAYMGTFPTQEQAEAARAGRVDVQGLRELAKELLAQGMSPALRKAFEDILTAG